MAPMGHFVSHEHALMIYLHDDLDSNVMVVFCGVTVYGHVTLKWEKIERFTIGSITVLLPPKKEKWKYPIRGMSTVIVWLADIDAESSASSCGNGTLLVQAFADQFQPLVHDHVCVAAVVNVIHEFHKQSQEFPEIAERFQLPAHAPVMSFRSRFVAETVAAVNVRDVPSTSVLINNLLTAELPFMFNVPVVVMFPDNTICAVFADHHAMVVVHDVNAETVAVPLCSVIDTILYVAELPVKFALTLSTVIVDVSGVNVQFDQE